MFLLLSRLLSHFFDDAKVKVGDARAFYDLYGLEFDRFFSYGIEQPDTVTEQERHEVDVDFVEQASLETLLHNSRTGNRDVLATQNCCRAALRCLACLMLTRFFTS